MAREWMRKAEDDFQVAEILARRHEPFHDQVSFHCQQSAEKYLKAVLEELGLLIPKTHDLEESIGSTAAAPPVVGSMPTRIAIPYWICC
jgi:HEPN domain-containing protein